MRGFDCACFVRRADDAIQAAVCGKRGESRDVRGKRFGNAELVVQFALTQAGEYGDGNQQRRLAVMCDGVGGGFEHFAPAAGVNVHHPHAHVGGDAQGGGDGVGDVVKFEVKEDVVANALQGFDQRPALARVQFFADFDAAQFGRELRRQHERVLAAIDIKRDEQRFVFHRFSTLSSSIGRKLLQAKQAGQCQMRFCWRKPHSLHWYTVRGAISLPAVLASGAKFVRYVR